MKHKILKLRSMVWNELPVTEHDGIEFLHYPKRALISDVVTRIIGKTISFVTKF